MNPPTQNPWKNSLHPKGDVTEPIQLARGGRALARIIVPDGASSTEQKAAIDLAEHLKRITGVEFIVTRRNGGAAIYISTCPSLGTDGIRLHAAEGSLHITGGTGRGVINAVYAFLEEDLGCRWYGNGAERFPADQDLTVTVVEREYIPQLKLRDPYYYPSFDGDWSLKNRTSAPDAPVPAEWGGHASFPGSARGVRHGESLFVHTYHQLLSPDPYFEDHPEYFQLTEDGKRIPHQLCETHPDVHRLVAESVRKVMHNYSDATFLSVSKMDGGGTCQCDRCRSLNAAEGSDAASLLTLVNAVAEQVEPDFPNLTLTTLAYLETVHLPATIRPRHNVGIRLCNDICSWRHPFTPVRKHEELVGIVEAWCAVCPRMYYWDYNANFSHYAAPFPNLHIIADNIRFWVDHQAVGLMTQGAFQSEGSERDLLRSWVIAKLMWDPRLDVQELTQDFIRGYFGEAAGPIEEYNESLHQQALTYAHELQHPKGGIRFGMNECFLTDGFIEEAEALYREAFALAGNDSELQDRIERDSLPILYVQIQQHTGPVDAAQVARIDAFERIAKRVGLTFTGETRDPGLDWQLTLWREGHSGSMVSITPEGGRYPEPVEVTISSPMAAVKLTYTLDGSEPNAASPEAEETILIDQTCSLKVGVFSLGSHVGATGAVHEYVISRSDQPSTPP